MKLYSVYDCKTEELAPPYVAKNDEAAKRLFLDIIKSNQIMKANASDFSLYKICDFVPDDLNCSIVDPDTIRIDDGGHYGIE